MKISPENVENSRVIDLQILKTEGCSFELDVYLSHTRTTVRVCCKGDDQSQCRRANFDPPPPLNPLTDLNRNLCRWLRRRYLPPCKILSKSDKGFRFHACASSRRLFTWLFFWFCPSPAAKTPPRTSTPNTSKDAVLCKDMPFKGRKTKI